ncbi:hypothetical protein TEA_019936 [Camellia sinensis var. sinensis]|uniref:UvrD-like helicase C-terminal domain-containing protein n=1 Tax=Camellia sinensis var. sinensis TaxID=542762 RepID=A0A4S4D3V3_CAMSN|nr:hypothetical protein TEA_019936 [Camellia sinensis var. sinensis]
MEFGCFIMQVLQYLLDDVSEFLSTRFIMPEEGRDIIEEDKGCINVLKAFIDYISERESENFRSRRHNNKDGVTLTTIHQSKGLEWDNVFIVKEERRLLYVAMTRARKKLFILYVIMDSNWQMLQPSRFLKEIPDHLREIQSELNSKDLQEKDQQIQTGTHCSIWAGLSRETESSDVDIVLKDTVKIPVHEGSKESMESMEACYGNSFLKRFIVEDRAVVSHLFHQWAKKPAFQDAKRLLDKVGFAIDERLRVKKSTHKDVMRELKSCLKCDEAFQYAQYVLRWEQIPADKRAHLMREKQIAYLQSLGCTVVPSSRLHASRLIEEYKSL